MSSHPQIPTPCPELGILSRKQTPSDAQLESTWQSHTEREMNKLKASFAQLGPFPPQEISHLETNEQILRKRNSSLGSIFKCGEGHEKNTFFSVGSGPLG